MSTAPLPINEFAAKVRAKYPGAYDHVNDATLVQKITDKYPEYKDHIASYAPTQFEQDRQPGMGSGLGGHLLSAGKNLVSGLLNGAVTNPTEAAGSGVAQAGQMAADDLDRKQAGRSTAYRIGAPLAQTVVPGLNPHAMERAADRGDAGGVLGEAAIPALAAGATYGVKAGTPPLRRAVASQLFTPEGTPTHLGAALSDPLHALPEYGLRKLAGVEAPEVKGPSVPIRQSPGFNASEYNAGRKGAISAPSAPETNTEGVAAPQADVVKVPVPRELGPGERVGYNASTPRKLVLDNALQGRPGAAEMLRNMGKTPLFVSEGGYAPPREKISFGESRISDPGDLAHSSIPFNNPGVSSAHATLNPIGQTGARPIVSPTHQFESSFGPEHQEVGDLAEWETGSREGVRPKKILVP